MKKSLFILHVCLFFRVNNFEKSATKSSYQIEDGSGSIECIQWMEEGHPEPEYGEGSTVKVIGSIRTQGNNFFFYKYFLTGFSSFNF